MSPSCVRSCSHKPHRSRPFRAVGCWGPLILAHVVRSDGKPGPSDAPGRALLNLEQLEQATALADTTVVLQSEGKARSILGNGHWLSAGPTQPSTSNAAPHTYFPRQFGNAGPRHACTGVSTTPPMPQPANTNPPDPGSIDRDHRGRLAPSRNMQGDAEDAGEAV